MAKHDLYNNLSPVVGLTPRAISSNTTTTGSSIDMSGFESILFILMTGTITDGDYTMVIQESDDNSTFTDVADADLIGTEAATSTTDDTDDNKVGKIGYKGIKRYVRSNIVSTNVTSGGTLGIVAVRGNALIAPVAYTAP